MNQIRIDYKIYFEMTNERGKEMFDSYDDLNEFLYGLVEADPLYLSIHIKKGNLITKPGGKRVPV